MFRGAQSVAVHLAGSPTELSSMIMVVPLRCMRAVRAKFNTLSKDDAEKDENRLNAGEDEKTESEESSYSNNASYYKTIRR